MKRLLPAITICVLALTSNITAQKPIRKTASGLDSISSQALKGFETCKYSTGLTGLLTRLYKTGVPVKKDESFWQYNVSAEFLGLPVRGIQIGVCEDGSRDCGWGSYTALVIPMPLSESKKIIKQKTGIDFTVPKRATGEFGGNTLRPLLSEEEGRKNESVLFCDPGDI